MTEGQNLKLKRRALAKESQESRRQRHQRRRTRESKEERQPPIYQQLRGFARTTGEGCLAGGGPGLEALGHRGGGGGRLRQGFLRGGWRRRGGGGMLRGDRGG
jgi:hypothetical protein